MEATEAAVRIAALACGATALKGIIARIGSGRRDEPLMCCGQPMHSHGLKDKPLLTTLGDVPWARSMFVCDICAAVRFPGDEELDVVNTTRSPGVRRMMARAGSKDTFKDGRDDLKVYAGIDVSPKDVERVAEGIGTSIEAWQCAERPELMKSAEQEGLLHPKTIPVMYVEYDGTGVPMTQAELVGRRGKQEDGSAKTREAKLGCVFTQTTTDADGFPVRDPGSTTFVGAIETAEVFGERIYAEALRRGLLNAQQVVVLGDGAKWIRGIAEHFFPGATQIVDLYHAREHITDLCKLLFGSNENQVTHHRIRWWADLDAGRVEKIVDEARQKTMPTDAKQLKKVENEIDYLHGNRDRMRYDTFRKRGFFVGSGVVEAGCGSVIGGRLKKSGMEWSERGANAIIALRCLMYSGRFEDYWESRAA